MLCASLAHAGPGCGGGGCDSDKKDGKADYTQSNAVLAGGCGDKAMTKKTASPTLLCDRLLLSSSRKLITKSLTDVCS